jgi:hypothetical protein
VYGDYGGPIRRADGRVDVDATVARLKGLHVTTYAFLIWGWRYQAKPYYATDFEDLAAFLPAAARAGIEVWAYLPSPQEFERYAPPPCKGDFACWGTRLGQLAAAHSNLTTIVLDDCFSKPNAAKMTPEHVATMRSNARASRKDMQVYPIAYFTNAMLGLLRRDFTKAIDGIVFVDLHRTIDDQNKHLDDEVTQIDAVVKGTTTALVLHGADASAGAKAGDQASLSREVSVAASGPHTISFGEGDDLWGDSGKSAVPGGDGARVAQLLVNGRKVWERDVNTPAGPDETAGFQRHTLDVSSLVKPGGRALVTFRLLATRPQSNMPALDAVVYNVGFAGLSPDAAWKENLVGSGWSAAAEDRAYRNKANVLMVYANTVGTWTPDAAFISAGLNFGHNRVGSKLDGVITYLLDKTDTEPGSRYATVAALYGAWH